MNANLISHASPRSDYTAIAPIGLRALGTVHSYVDRSALPATLVELVYLRISQINGCAYCIETHARKLRQAGVSAEKLQLVSVWEDAGDLFTDEEAAALAWAETLSSVRDNHVPDEAYVNARTHFTEKELVDLTLAVGMINAYNFLGIAFRTQPLAARSGTP